MASADVRLQNALEAVAGGADGLSLAAARRLGAAALAAAALPPEQQLAAVLQLAVARPDEGLHPQAPGGAADGEQQRQWQWVLAATAIELLVNGHSSATASQVTGILEHQVLPLLDIDTAAAAGPPGAAASQQQQEELLAAVAQLVAGCSCWNLGLQLVRAAAVSRPADPHSSSSSPTADAGIASQLPPHMRVRLAAAVVQQALEAASRQGSHPQPELDALLHHAATQTLPDVLDLLATGPPAQRRQRGKGGALPAAQLIAAATRAAAVQLLLPAALQAAVQQQGQAAAMEQLWEACK